MMFRGDIQAEATQVKYSIIDYPYVSQGLRIVILILPDMYIRATLRSPESPVKHRVLYTATFAVFSI